MQKIIFVLAVVMLVSGCGPGKSRPHRPQVAGSSAKALPDATKEIVGTNDTQEPVAAFESGDNAHSDSVLADPDPQTPTPPPKAETIAAIASAQAGPIVSEAAAVVATPQPVIKLEEVKPLPSASTKLGGPSPATPMAQASGSTSALVQPTPSPATGSVAPKTQVAVSDSEIKKDDKPSSTEVVVVAGGTSSQEAVAQPAASTNVNTLAGRCPGVSAQDPDWYPGLPTMLSTQPLFTGAIDPINKNPEDVKKDPSVGFRYVDSSADGLLLLAMDKVKSLPQPAQDEDRRFAPRFSDIEVSTEVKKSGRVKVRFLYEYKSGKFAPITLEGRAKDAKKKNRSDIELKQVSGRLSPGFAGHLACMDADGGCQTTAITLQRLGKDGKPGRSARAVHRFGEARLTLADLDLRAASTIQNKSHKALAEYLANTVNNSCLLFMAETKAAGRALDPCEAQRLQMDCGDGQKHQPAAKAVVARSWAVAFGRSGFEVALEERGAGVEKSARAKLVIAGPLGISSQRPMWPHNLLVKGGFGITEAHLIATDGGGNLNLQLVFAGEPKSHTRLNVTSLFESVRTVNSSN